MTLLSDYRRIKDGSAGSSLRIREHILKQAPTVTYPDAYIAGAYEGLLDQALMMVDRLTGRDMETGGQIECMNRECPVGPSVFRDHEKWADGYDLAVDAWNTRASGLPNVQDERTPAPGGPINPLVGLRVNP